MKNSDRTNESEVVQEVQRGKPMWMEELDRKTAQIAVKLKGKEVNNQVIDSESAEEGNYIEAPNPNEEKEFRQKDKEKEIQLEEEKTEIKSSSETCIIDASNSQLDEAEIHPEGDTTHTETSHETSNLKSDFEQHT